ncbi:MAG: ABC transporter ATP-binding protein [Fibrobacter sp.]|nr:ABC transporter ATP-binding protein [Fibrobacter sp.]
MNYAAWLWRNTRGTRLNALVRIWIGLVQVVLGLLMVWLSKKFIDETIRTGTSHEIAWMIAFLVLTVVGRILLRQVYYYMTTVTVTRKSNALRLDLFSRYFSKHLFSEHDFHSGDITSRLTKDIDSVATVIADTLPQMVVTGMQLLGAFLLMRFFDARLAWALVIFTPFAIIIGKFIAHRLKNMTHDIREKESNIQMHVQEGVEHNAVLRSLGSEQWMTERLGNMQSELESGVQRRTKFSTVTRFMLGCAFGIGYLMAFVWGGIGLRNGVITFGVMTSFLQLVGQIQQPILTLLNMTPQVVHSTASIDRLEEIRTNDDAADDVHDAVLNGAILNGAAGVRFEDVSFKYAKGDREIITHFTHDFKPGTKTALLGETGAGKTTLFRMMLGFIAPAGGSVSVYEAQSNTGDKLAAGKATRMNFVYVPQGNTLMSGSIRYNMLLAKPSASEEELKAALHTACADFALEFPHGLDTEIGERGAGLSEGQAQRIAIARGLLRPGSILLLDEISASLDEETERELYTRLFAAYPEKTMIFITHRSAICTLCDEIVRV